MGKRTPSIASEYARLTVKVETEDFNFGYSKFELLVSQAIKEILGSCGPDFKVDFYDATSKKGSVIATGEDILRIWAALSCYGSLYERRVAVHFHALTEYQASQ